MLGLANRIHELIEKKKSYAALRALDGTGNTLWNVLNGRTTKCSPQRDYSIRFCGGHQTSTHLLLAVIKRQSIPATRQVLQDSVMADLKSWLLGIRERSREIGEVAFHHTELKREDWRQISEQDPILAGAVFNSALERVYDEQDECIHTF